MKKPNDYPLQECADAAEKLIDKGWLVFQKWTCDKCGDRVTANTPNTFTTLGHHEACGFITDITKTGCNYMIIMGAQRDSQRGDSQRSRGGNGRGN